MTSDFSTLFGYVWLAIIAFIFGMAYGVSLTLRALRVEDRSAEGDLKQRYPWGWRNFVSRGPVREARTLELIGLGLVTSAITAAIVTVVLAALLPLLN